MSNVLFLKILRQLDEISIVKNVFSTGTIFIWGSTPEVKGCTFLLASHFSFSQVLAVFPRLLIHFHSNTCWGTNSTKKYIPFRTPSQTNDLTKWVCCERHCWLSIVFFLLLGQCIFDLFLRYHLVCTIPDTKKLPTSACNCFRPHQTADLLFHFLPLLSFVGLEGRHSKSLLFSEKQITFYH